MLIFATYFILLFVLLIVNSIPIIASKRTRRFASKPSLYFIILFVTFLGGRIVGFVYYEMNGREQRALDTSYDVTKIRGRIYTQGEVRKEFSSKNQIASAQKSFYENVNYILKMACIQALLVVLFSYFGMKKYEKRYTYYRQKMIVHGALFLFCVILDAFVF